MIVVKNIVEKANALITAGGLTKDQIDQLIGAEKFLDDASALSVATVGALPSAANNRGRIYYVTAEQRYYFSDGTYWRKDFTSSLGAEVMQTISFAWGLNNYGQLGTGTTTSSRSPINVVGGFTDWNQLSAGYRYTLGLTTTGVAYAWGSGANGRLGDNTTSNRSSPITVVGGIINWSQLSAGTDHSLGLTSTGVIYAWGSNSGGCLGDNTINATSSPITVIGGITTWSQISAGYRASMALTSAGVAYAWGTNTSGKLGDDTTSNRSSPVTVVGGISTWRSISTSSRGNFSFGITSANVLYAWGLNGTAGYLGDGTTSSRLSPVTVVGGITTWSSIAPGRFHTLALTSGNILYSWGYNGNGRLGDNTTSARSSPVTVVGGLSTWKQASGGDRHSLGVTTTGIAYGWGYNLRGQIGDNTTAAKSSPVTVVGGITTWSQVTAGSSYQSLAIRAITAIKGFL